MASTKSCNEGFNVIREDSGECFQETAYGLESAKMLTPWNKSSVSRKITKAHSYSGFSGVSAPEHANFFSGYNTHGYHESRLDVDAQDNIYQKKSQSRSGSRLRAYAASVAAGSKAATTETEWGRKTLVASRKPRSKTSTRPQDWPARSYTSHVQKGQYDRNSPIFEEQDEFTEVAHASGTQGIFQTVETSRTAADCGNAQKSTRSNDEIHIDVSGNGCLSQAFTDSYSAEQSNLSKQGSLGVVLQGLRCGRSNKNCYPGERCTTSRMGLALGKGLSRSSFKNFSCITSAEVLPSVTNCLTNGLPSQGFVKQKAANGTSSPKTHRGLFTQHGSASNNTSYKEALGSAFKPRRLSFMRRACMNSDTPVSRSRLANRIAVHELGDGGKENVQAHTEPCESSSRTSNGSPKFFRERSHRAQRLTNNRIEAMDDERRSAARFWVGSEIPSPMAGLGRSGRSASSSIFSGLPSTSRPPPRVSSPFGTPRHRRHLEPVCSPSYLSSPEVQYNTSGLPCSHSSSFQSPSLTRAVSSPESHHTGTVETPVFRPLRQFPVHGFEQSQAYFTFRGLPEILSTREHAERDELSYELFMFEANLFLNGIASHDQHRDMRLDVDNMSYEELLALEESIGNVSTGLDKCEIVRCLKRKSYSFADKASVPAREDNEVKCSICQDEFDEGVQLGVLDCGHSHHFSCIEQWLLQKNQCPICKTSAS